MNFGANQEQDETAIELTSLIDVVFLLLIFFMISTTFTKETTLKINLPESASDNSAEQVKSVEVHVAASSEYAIAADNEGAAKALINSNRETLLKALSKFQADESVLLVIRADKKATHEAVIKVLDVAQELGMNNITFATQSNK